MAYTKGSKSYTFTANTDAKAEEVNQNFDDAWDTEFTNIQTAINGTGTIKSSFVEIDQTGTDSQLLLDPMSEPTTNLTDGDLYFDSTDGLKQYLSGAWSKVGGGSLQDAYDNGNGINIGSNPVAITRPSTTNSYGLSVLSSGTSSSLSNDTLVDVTCDAYSYGTAVEISRNSSNAHSAYDTVDITDLWYYNDSHSILYVGDGGQSNGNTSKVGINVQFVNDTGAKGINVYMNSDSTVGLDIRGKATATGGFANSCPVMLEDGVDIPNYGGINGGQLAGLPRDVLVFADADMSLSGSDLSIPNIKFYRFTKKGVSLVTKTATIPKEQTHNLGFKIPLEEGEHLVNVSPTSSNTLLTTNKGNKFVLGSISTAGDYGFISSTGEVRWDVQDIHYHSDTDIDIEYTVRVDGSTPSKKTFSISSQTLTIPSQPAIVYLKETIDDTSEVTPQDTAAMTPNTSMSIVCEALDDYEYSADTYVLGVVFNDKITQYYKVI